ncbi:MAG: twin transmembrane helix small protein [Rhodospirillales bacterium]|nr:twin transmembrane helix small protein [Rhodospirillales bacterium]
MNPLFVTLIGIALLAVLGVLFAGLFSMARGGEFNKKHGNKLMRWRVGLQGVALVLLALAFLVGKD